MDQFPAVFYQACYYQNCVGLFDGSLWDIIGALGTIVAGIGLFFTAYEIIQNRKAKQDAITEQIFKDLMDLETSLAEIEDDDPKYDFKFRVWFSKFANTLEYFAFRVNNGKLTEKESIDFFVDAVIDWYKNIFEKHGGDAVKDPKQYEELKRLYSKYKDQYKEKA